MMLSVMSPKCPLHVCVCCLCHLVTPCGSVRSYHNRAVFTAKMQGSHWILPLIGATQAEATRDCPNVYHWHIMSAPMSISITVTKLTDA